jgi:hypothetical protein
MFVRVFIFRPKFPVLHDSPGKESWSTHETRHQLHSPIPVYNGSRSKRSDIDTVLIIDPLARSYRIPAGEVVCDFWLTVLPKLMIIFQTL